MKMKKKDLEIVLQKLPSHPSPMVNLEQYFTPANIAADILFNAYLDEDISEKTVLDLGCGTGIFALGSKLLSADEVIGIDIDPTVLKIASANAEALSLDITFIEGDINVMDLERSTNKTISDVDTIIQNPPFGAQKNAKGVDRIFLKKALTWGKVVYSIHLSKTEEFIELLVDKLGGKLVWKKKYIFPINRMFFFHTKEKMNFEVTLFKIESMCSSAKNGSNGS